jgi:predicted MFS family arabinose efflux permease
MKPVTSTASEPEAPAAFRWDRLTVASATGYCLLVATLSIGNVLGELRAEFDLSGVVTALHGSMFGAGLVLVGAFGVRVIDRYGRRGALGATVVGSLIGVALVSIGPSWPVTLLGAALGGLAGATYVLVISSVISDHHGPNLGRALAAVNAVPAIAGIAFGFFIGGALSAGWSWRPPYLALTALFAIIAAVAARPVPMPSGVRHGTFTLRHFRERAVLVPSLFIVNGVLVEFSIGVWSVTYLREVGGASSGAAPLLATVFGVMLFSSRLALHPIQRRFGANTIAASFAVVAIGSAVMVFVPSLAARVVGLALVGFGGGPIYPLAFERLHAQASHRIDSVGLGAYSALATGVGILVGPLILGVLADSVGLRWGLLYATGLAVVGMITQRARTGTPPQV